MAIIVTSSDGDDIWVYDVETGAGTRVTFTGLGLDPLWSPDGERLFFTMDGNIYSSQRDGENPTLLVEEPEGSKLPISVSPDGRVLLFEAGGNEGGGDIWAYRVGEAPEPIVQTPANERGPMFSPDGDWFAYTSNESGRHEVYVRPFPGPGPKTVISTDGGWEPTWSPDGRELFYRSGVRMMTVPVQTKPTFDAGKPMLVFEGDFNSSEGGHAHYNVAADGQRFLMVSTDTSTSELHLVLNWFEELKRLVPTERR